jgi:hypothetical protein
MKCVTKAQHKSQEIPTMMFKKKPLVIVNIFLNIMCCTIYGVGGF